ncbi:LysR family transcriptional regulator, partial [Clostridioides difficile]|nr:LysR family transcriptional regulator [Clostridioides difficile]
QLIYPKTRLDHIMDEFVKTSVYEIAKQLKMSSTMT